MKRRVTRCKRWHGTFRSTRRADHLWIYSGTRSVQGAVWHRHPGDNRPHLHVRSSDGEHHGHAIGHDRGYGHHHQGHAQVHQRRHHKTQHEADNHHLLPARRGHWHRIIPVAQVHLTHQLLVIDLHDVCFETRDDASAIITFGPPLSARAPPGLKSFH